MAYNWARLAFAGKWRLNAVRGPLIGMPVVVQLPEGGRGLSLQPGQRLELSISETPEGFLVV